MIFYIAKFFLTSLSNIFFDLNEKLNKKNSATTPKSSDTTILYRKYANRTNFSVSINISPMIFIKFCDIMSNAIREDSIITFYVSSTNTFLCFKRRYAMNYITRSINSFHCSNLKVKGWTVETVQPERV